MNKLRFIQNLSIRNKVILIILSITFLIHSIGFTFITIWDINRIKSEISTGLSLNTKLVADNCVVPLTFEDKQQATEALSHLKNVKFIETACLFDKAGSFFASYPETMSENSILESQNQVYNVLEKGFFYVKEDVVYQNETYGTLFVKANSKPLKTAKRNIILMLVLLSIILDLLVIILAGLMQKYISLPIIKLKNHFDQVAENQDFSMILPRESQDEIGSLYDGFNNLTKQILIRSKERDKAEAKYKDSQNKLDLALQGGGIGIWEWDLASNLTLWDEKMERMFGLEKGEFNQSYEAFKACLHHDDVSVTERAINEALNGGSPYDAVFRVIWKNKEVKYIRAKALVVRNDEGKPVSMLGICTDVSNIKKTEDELKKHRDKLEELVNERTKELESFSYSVSHDLRAPLRGIDGFSLALLEDYSEVLDEQGKNYLNRVRLGSQKMALLIDELLNLSRLGRRALNPTDVDLTALAGSLLHDFAEHDPNRSVEIIIEKEMMCFADSTLIRAVLQNLLENAWKFTSKKQDAKIEFGSLEKEGKRVYFVKDNGAGFNMEYKNKLFTAFQRLHQASEFPGTGIGLTTVQRIIHRHKGDLWAEGEIGKGAIFYFTLNL